MNHDMPTDAPGYRMPPAVLPGMPAGDDQRPSVAVTITTTGDPTRRLRPADEFVLRTGNRKHWPPAELTDSDAWVEWTNEGYDGRAGDLTEWDAIDPPHSHNSVTQIH
jgi:hypothetical protein